ncbi:hypothetical protein K440DRAFT_238598 [Wilcoxina mikolae CBS 423.85]|nr:hypothetical protein K440DRAFT_238598 [Wilcoxina mikolae CBS 423.85]
MLKSSMNIIILSAIAISTINVRLHPSELGLYCEISPSFFLYALSLPKCAVTQQRRLVGSVGRASVSYFKYDFHSVIAIRRSRVRSSHRTFLLFFGVLLGETAVRVGVWRTERISGRVLVVR